MSPLLRPPVEGTFPTYYGRYIDPLADGPVLELLADQVEETAALLDSIGEDLAGYRYAEEKWSVKEVVGHVMDVERIFATRALRFARGDGTPLPAFEQNAYVANADLDARPLAALIEELRALRASTLAMFRGFDAEALARTGTAAGGSFTVASIAWIIAGHEAHHARMLKERYLPGIQG